MSTPARYIAFDLGAESSRAIVGEFGDNALELKELHRFPSRNVEIHGTKYWDILYIFAQIKEGLHKYSLEYGPDVCGIGVDSWGVDYGLLGKSGQLIQNPVQYRDHRTDDIHDSAFEVLPREAIYARTGIQFLTFNTLYQLWAARTTAPETIREAHDFLMISDLLHYFLTGRIAVEYTNASTTQLLDVHTGQWSRSLMTAFGLPMDIMPEIIQPASIIAPLDERIAKECGLNVMPVIAPCTHDTGSAVAAAPVLDDGPWAYISCGTWSLMGAELKEPHTSEKALAYNFTNEGGINGTFRFLKNIMGLWVLQQSRRAWAKRGQDYEYDQLSAMAREEKPFQAVINVDEPLFLNPDDMLEAIEEHCKDTGQAMPATMGGVVRTILEGVAIRYALVLEQLEDVMGERIERVHMLGGGIQNEFLCQLAADAMNRTVITGPIEATAIGNLIAQGMATGQLADHAAARKLIADTTPLKTYEPGDRTGWDEAIAKIR